MNQPGSVVDDATEYGSFHFGFPSATNIRLPGTMRSPRRNGPSIGHVSGGVGSLPNLLVLALCYSCRPASLTYLRGPHGPREAAAPWPCLLSTEPVPHHSWPWRRRPGLLPSSIGRIRNSLAASKGPQRAAPLRAVKSVRQGTGVATELSRCSSLGGRRQRSEEGVS